MYVYIYIYIYIYVCMYKMKYVYGVIKNWTITLREKCLRISVSLRIQPECWKIRTRITPNTNTFYAV